MSSFEHTMGKWTWPSKRRLILNHFRERSGSVVKCLTEGPRVRAGVTALCHWARHINPSLVLVQRRKTRPYVAERLLMGRKESNQTKLHHFIYLFSGCNLAPLFRTYIYYPRTRNTGNILNDTSACWLRRLANDFAR